MHLVKNDPHPAPGLLLVATRASCRAAPWELVKGLSSKSLPNWGLPTPALSVEAQRDWASSDPHVRQCVSGRAEIWIQRFPTTFSMFFHAVWWSICYVQGTMGGWQTKKGCSLCTYNAGDIARASQGHSRAIHWFSCSAYTHGLHCAHSREQADHINQQTASCQKVEAVESAQWGTSHRGWQLLGKTAGGWDLRLGCPSCRAPEGRSRALAWKTAQGQAFESDLLECWSEDAAI